MDGRWDAPYQLPLFNTRRTGLRIPRVYGAGGRYSDRERFLLFVARRYRLARTSVHVSLCAGALGDRPLAQPPVEPSPAPSIHYLIHPQLHRPDSASRLGCHVFDQQLARDIASLDAVLGPDVAAREPSRITVPMNLSNEAAVADRLCRSEVRAACTRPTRRFCLTRIRAVRYGLTNRPVDLQTLTAGANL